MQPVATPGTLKLTPEETEQLSHVFFDKHGRGIRYLHLEDGTAGQLNRKQRRLYAKLAKR